MATYRVKPTKPMAVFGAIFGVAIFAFGVVSMTRHGHAGAFLWLWLVAGVAIISFNLWAAFSPNGGLQTMTTSDQATQQTD